MKSTVLSSSVKTIIKDNFKRSWAVPVISLISFLIVGPIVYILLGDEETQSSMLIYDASGYNAGFLFTFFLLGIASGLAVFNYLQKNSSADFMHALPVKRGVLFAANYVSGLLFIVIPVTINALVMMMLGDHLIKEFFIWLGLGCLACTAVYSITVLAGIMSGSQFMHLFNAFFYNLLAVLLVTIAENYLAAMAYGYYQSSTMSAALENSFPLSAFTAPSALTVAVWAGITILVTALAYIAYKKRAIEDTGKALVFKWSLYVSIGLVTFMGATLMGLIFYWIVDPTIAGGCTISLVIGILLGFIVTFIVISIMAYKSPRIFGKKNMITCGVTAAVIAVFVGVMSSNLTGFENVNFKAVDLKGAAVSDVVMVDEYSDRFDSNYFSAEEAAKCNYPDLASGYYEDEANIEAICAMQNIIANEGAPSSEEVSYEGQTMGFEFVSKTGRHSVREYNFYTKEAGEKIQKYMAQVFESKEFKERFKLGNLKLNPSEIILSDSNNAYQLTKEQGQSLIAAMDEDFEDMSYDTYVKMYDGYKDEGEEIILDEGTYMLDIEENAEDSGDYGYITDFITKDSPAAYKWIQDHKDELKLVDMEYYY